MIKKIFIVVSLLGLIYNPASYAFSDRIDQSVEYVQSKLNYASPERLVHARASALMDVEYYYIDQRPPGLLFGKDDFVNPRATFFLEGMLGSHLYGLLQARVDRGVDPGIKQSDARLDEYFLRYTPFEKPIVSLQAGKFATIVGNWIQRHDSWENPFITPPLVYENFTRVADGAAPKSKQGFLMYRTTENDIKTAWLPVIWGFAYTTGAAVMGQAGDFDYAFSVKNASISSRPAVWKGSQQQWTDPTYSARLGWRPSTAWNLGVSGSLGTYLKKSAASTLPPGKEIGDYLQVTVGQDWSYAYRKLQLWGEFFWSQFEIPFVGQANTFSYYVEGKYKLTPAIFVALRWNQQLFGDIEDGNGGKKAWDRDIFRTDLSLGYRITRYLQAKLQYNYSHRKGDKQQGENLLATQMTLKI